MTLAAPGATARRVRPATSLSGTIDVPGDKSISHRAVLLNALGRGRARVSNFSPGADCASTIACLRQLGVSVRVADGQVDIHGVGLHGLREPDAVLDCGNSGTTMRLLSGALAGAGVFAVLTGDDSLRRRPMARIVEPLRRAGAAISGREQGRLAPLVVQPVPKLKGVEHALAVASAQVKSALLVAGLHADGPTTVVEPGTTRDHTERMVRAMGATVNTDGNRIRIEPAAELACVDVVVPGDFSSAAFWLVLGVLHPNAQVRINNVGVNPTRTGLLTILQQMGAQIERRNERDVAGEPVADLVARSSALRGVNVGHDLVALAIDEVPLVALLGLFADGETVVRDASELRAKESDRLATVAEGLSTLGGQIEATSDGWRVRRTRLESGHVASHGDHRMAMLFALAGTLGDGAEIEGAESVQISYPSFWSDLERLSRGG